MRLNDLVPHLQAAISPMILISGIGLILLSMTNRYARIIDRSRQVAEAYRKGLPSRPRRLVEQLRILAHRARLLRTAITLASFSVLLAALLVITLFLAALVGFESSAPIVVIFIGCLVSLIASLLMFLRDINISLQALVVEISGVDESVDESMNDDTLLP